MGCSFKAISEDEDDFDYFCKQVKIKTNDLDGCYGTKYRYAKKFYSDKKLVGPALLKAVDLMMQMDAIEKQFADDTKLYKHYLELKDRFEPKK
jgi:hypothetical protein